MKTRHHSLRKIVAFLNNPDEDGGFWLPNIQRPFVWTEDQTCRLFDSILREYPISTLLVWKTTSSIRRRKFIDNFLPIHRKSLSTLYVPEDNKRKCLVLDGQQRLQSLYIALKGSYEGRELYFDVLSGEVAAPDDIKYKFEFKAAGAGSFPWVRFKELVFSTKDAFTAAADLMAGSGQDLSAEQKAKIGKHVGLVFKAFHSDDGISYQELDSTENADLYTEDDVVEIFIRANSGGTRLGKSDLLFSLLTSTWDDADSKMEVLLEQLNRHGFEFTRDFVLKVCLTLLDQGARYEVGKFRKAGIREKIEENWDDIESAIKDVLDFVRGKTFIKCDKALPSYLSLIPLIYVRYHFKPTWATVKGVETYLVRTALSGAFGGTPDQLIDVLVKKLSELRHFDLTEVFGVIRANNRNLEITEDRLMEMGYGSDTIHLLFNLWYPFNYTPAYDRNLPQVDHIFARSILRKVKTVNPATGRKDIMKYPVPEQNQLANCMLLTAAENGASGKSDATAEEWFAGKDDAYLDLHLIPKDRALWKLDRFQDFIEARKKLILEKFKYLLSNTHIEAIEPPTYDKEPEPYYPTPEEGKEARKD